MPIGERTERSVTETAPTRGAWGSRQRRDSPDEDACLLREFRSGDETAFDRLYVRHVDYIYNVCVGILNHHEDARDCAQETFLRAYSKAAGFRSEAAFSTWLYRIAVNVCVGQLRKRPRQPDSSLEDQSVREIADDSSAAWINLERAADEQVIREVVATLSDDYRVVLALRYFDDRSYEEMVQILGFNLGQVKVKLHRARRAFARKWAERERELAPGC